MCQTGAAIGTAMGGAAVDVAGAATGASTNFYGAVEVGWG
jgi:hypothetical protein